MSTCSNCYNGCTEITSDKCVMYTGIDVPLLGVKKGDSLSYVEQAIITFLGSTLDGSGIKINIDEVDYCAVVSDYLQECQDVTALDLFRALVKAACSIQSQVTGVVATVGDIQAEYTVDCLSGVTGTDGVHDILQAVINKLCLVDDELTALALDVETNYVKIADFGDLVDAYLAAQPSSTLHSAKMVPYTVVEYYGSLANFDVTGAGTGDWLNIYLCNGLNGTPDKRGRTTVGAIVGIPGGALDPTVNPASSPFNPNYSIGGTTGTNSITLTGAQIPSHTHTVSDPQHHHLLFRLEDVNNTPLNSSTQVAATERTISGGGNSDYEINAASSGDANVGKSSSSSTGITLGNTGGGEAHNNIQPSIAAYYIMYIP